MLGLQFTEVKNLNHARAGTICCVAGANHLDDFVDVENRNLKAFQ